LRQTGYVEQLLEINTNKELAGKLHRERRLREFKTWRRIILKYIL
jgi:hypothetical protein